MLTAWPRLVALIFDALASMTMIFFRLVSGAGKRPMSPDFLKETAPSAYPSGRDSRQPQSSPDRCGHRIENWQPDLSFELRNQWSCPQICAEHENSLGTGGRDCSNHFRDLPRRDFAEREVLREVEVALVGDR